ncbi:hypothetical protein ACLQ3K_13425 [Tsukamurella sp. DT100]|uniref:hypothetical protein n=1 Tax=Tsukamurella sp. DT100 TaxID=3393415 RepID=UPI003CF0D043
MVAPGTCRGDVEAIVGALRGLVGAAGGPPPVAASVGVAIVPALDPRRMSEAIALADAALYEAKADRSLRVVVCDPNDAAA